ncbi:MAG TPA: hypothetical protein VFO95_12335 [Gemmatimonadales bacterium]|nr:hypothetical protein [Gemmatimonadales bacterium]
MQSAEVVHPRAQTSRSRHFYNLHSAICTLQSVLLLSGCGLSPLTNKIEIGQEPFIVLVGESPDGQTDLFALRTAGGEAVRFTFTRMKEYAPAIHPTGAALAYLRRPAQAIDSSPATLVVLNLINSSERLAELPAGIGVPRRIGWSRDGTGLYVLGDLGIAAADAPPAAMAFAAVDTGSAGWIPADSATSILVGEPPIARIETCAKDCISSAALPWCVISPDGRRTELGRVVTPFRWGSDSLAFFQGEELLLYALAGGRPRRMEWNRAPKRPRDGSYWEPE